MDDLIEDFIADTRETLEALTSQLVEWERRPHDRALLDSVFRFVHTLRGSCGFLHRLILRATVDLPMVAL
mgnify:CR=1 FL=1